jgi:hypothetical protein
MAACAAPPTKIQPATWPLLLICWATPESSTIE